MNKKGFVLMETIVVIVVISVALLTIFASYSKILTKVKIENKYDTSEYIYMTKYVRDYLKGEIDESDGFSMDSTVGEPLNHSNLITNNIFKIKGIYLLKKLNDSTDENLKKFDANMIDYIRKLDVGSSDIILIVEYDRDALDEHGEKIRPTNCESSIKVAGKCPALTETYIASLEW